MEKLFRDTFVEERDRVCLATHFLDGEACRWWLDILDNPNTDLAAISSARFKELLLAHYFSTNAKRKIEQNLCSLRQGDRHVHEPDPAQFPRLSWGKLLAGYTHLRLRGATNSSPEAAISGDVQRRRLEDGAPPGVAQSSGHLSVRCEV
ncbi:uncharacterized protein LOC109704653 [Ananas comosus]|uniref:Uncharacterized protein LOC109704653 n=1 Tax=Ananas comosus TaxID=4615 RepID=A0A6P5ECU1_ANACO|nr:uncharacterized protein LOC109704653 [Ananas comosus]